MLYLHPRHPPRCSLSLRRLNIFLTRSFSTPNPESIEKFFAKHAGGRAKFVASALTPKSIPSLGRLPEVLVTGRANVGKSTLLNAVMARKDLVRTSKKAGRTKALNFFTIGEPAQFVLVDSPGYGARGREEWGELFEHYVANRKVLRRILLLVNPNHGFKPYDEAFIQSLDTLYPLGNIQPIFTKIDTIAPEEAQEKIDDMRKAITTHAPKSMVEILTAAGRSPPIGVEGVQKAIYEACVVNGHTVSHTPVVGSL